MSESALPPFAGTPDFKSLPPPPLQEHNLRVEAVLRPSYNILSLAELHGTSFVLSGDGKGFISAWDVHIKNRKNELDPEHYFEAHSGAINQVITLRSGRLPELVEEYEWPRGESEEKRQALNIGDRGIDTAVGQGVLSPTGVPQLSDSPNPSPAAIFDAPGKESPLAEMMEREEDVPQQPRRSWLARKLSCCGRCFGQKRDKTRHWLIATASEDGTVRVWRWRLLPKGHKHHDHDEPKLFEVDFITEWASEDDLPIVTCLELFDGHLVIALQGSADVRILDPGASVVRWVLYGHTGPITTLAQCVDGRLISGASDGAVRLWSFKGDDARTVAWPDPEEDMPLSGVSSLAFFAHTQQEHKGEYVTVCTRIFVPRAEQLPKADLFSASDPYVTCTLVEGLPGIIDARTASRRSLWWNHRLTISLRRYLLEGKWQVPQSAVLDFEVYSESRMFGKPTLLAHWAIPVATVLNDIQQDAAEAANPQPRKLHAPLGEGPFQDLKDSTIFIGFAQIGEHAIECHIESAEGLLAANHRRCYVRVQYKSNIERGSETSRITTQRRVRTSTIDNNLNPVWNEVLELHVPACHMESHFVYGRDLHLHFEVYDYDTLSSDDLLGTLTLPFDHALEVEGKDVKAYNVELAEAFKPKKGMFGKKNQHPLEPKLFLAFEILTPCPIQLRCQVESARSLAPCMGPTSAPIVRIRCVESNPLVPQMTSFRTHTIFRTTNPAWKEACVLPLPTWHWKNAMALRPASVRASWEHPSDAPEVIICAEVFDAESMHDDISLGRCQVSLETAVKIALDDKSQGAKPFELSGLSGFVASAQPALLYLGFETGDNDTELVVHIERAERLPTGRDISVDPYCVVKVSEVGAFGEPAERCQVKTLPIGKTSQSVNMSQTDPVWQHEDLLDMPGASWDGLVAVRPNWFLHFDVIDEDVHLRRESSLMQAVLPISEVLTDLAEAGRLPPTPELIQSRIDTLRGATLNPVKEAKPPWVTRQIALVDSSHAKTKPARGASGAAREVRSENLNSASSIKALGSSQMSNSPTGGRLKSLVSTISSFGSRHRSGNSPTGKNNPKQGKDLRAAGVGDDFLDVGSIDPSRNPSRLIVNFQAVTRWQGFGRDRALPLARKMTKASPVKSLLSMGSRIFAGYENGNVFVWDTAEGPSCPVHQFEAHRVPVSDIAYVPSLDCIVTSAFCTTRREAGSESLLRIWSVDSLELKQTISLHSASTRCLLSLTGDGEKAKKGSLALAIATETRQSKLIQILRLNKDQ